MSKKKKEMSQDEINAAMLAQLRESIGLSKDSDQLTLASEYKSIEDVVSTGSQDLDQILTPNFHAKNGRGGVPFGYVYEFYGPEGGGKSSLCLKLMASLTTVMKEWGLWLDAENSFQLEWSEAQGVDNAQLVRLEPGPPAEVLLERFIKLVGSGKFRLAVIDSMAALTPKRMSDPNLSDPERVGEKARLMSRCIPLISNAAKKGRCGVIFINQLRMLIGGYGNPETTPGGRTLKFFASLRLDVRPLGSKDKDRRKIMKDGVPIGLRAMVSVKKSRFGPPDNQAIVPIYYGVETPHPLDALIDAALAKRVVTVKKVGIGETESEVLSFSPKDEKGKALPGFANVTGVTSVDDLKTRLKPSQIKLMFERCVAKKFDFDAETKAYVDEVSLKKDEEGSWSAEEPAAEAPAEDGDDPLQDAREKDTEETEAV